LWGHIFRSVADFARSVYVVFVIATVLEDA
jgi:hypothetical protein